jgi:hypothetical protein
MNRLTISLLFACAAPLALAGPLQIAPVASPASGTGSDSPWLTTAPDGTVWLSWLETSDPDETAFKYSTFDSGAGRWSEARTIAHGRDWVTNVFDAPRLLVQAGGRVTAEWSIAVPDKDKDVDTPHAFIRQSADGGATWGAPRLLSTETESAEYVTLSPLSDGGILAAWIDARGRKTEATAPKLYSRRLDSTQPDLLVDASVCDCCRPILTGLPDGGALLAYRGRTADQIRDIQLAHFRDGVWDPGRVSTQDHWQIDGCPVNGPGLASRGPLVALVWFTLRENAGKVFALRSTDAGNHYSEPQRVDLGHSSGRVDTLLLRDGTQLVSWLEEAGGAGSAPAGLYLRSFGGTQPAIPPTRIVALQNDAVGRIFPRLAPVREETGAPPEVLAAYTRPGDAPRIEILRLTLPGAPALAARGTGRAPAL